MSEVYLAAVDRSLYKISPQYVVLKIAAARKLESNNDGIANEELLLSQLEHEGIVRLLPILDTAGQTVGSRARATLLGGAWFCAFEYLNGGSLHDMMLTQKALPSVRSVLEIAQQVALTLQYLHSKRIIHMDIKPTNLLFRNRRWFFGNRSQAVLTDFGIARKLNRESSTGSHDYMAPERRFAREARTAIHAHYSMDIYSFGVVLYELLTGEIPAVTFSTAPSHCPTLPARRGKAIRPFDGLVAATLAEQPTARPDATTLIAQLKQIQAYHRLTSRW